MSVFEAMANHEVPHPLDAEPEVALVPAATVVAAPAMPAMTFAPIGAIAAIAPALDMTPTVAAPAPVVPAVVTDEPVPTTTELAAGPKRSVVRISTVLFGVVLAVLLAFGGIWLATGGKYYIMSTPSMSPALPVGALVLTKPFSPAKVVVGTIIVFQPPTEVGRTFTHRVIAITPLGYKTKGDAERVQDDWTVPFTNVKGVVVQSLPAVGWLLRALPWLLVGLLLVIGFAALVPWRWGVFMPLLATVIVIAIPLIVLKPLVRGQLVETNDRGPQIIARVVNTGLLPLKFTPVGHPGVHIAAGHWYDFKFPRTDKAQHFDIHARVDLTTMGWIILGLLCLLPLILAIGVTIREWRKEKRGELVLPTAVDATEAAAPTGNISTLGW
jgi:signal peptidase I